MNRSFYFCTDNVLRINFWSKEIAEMRGRSTSTVMGKKYYEVLPRISVEGKDALTIAIQERKELNLKKYCFNCLNGQIRTDIRINPVEATNGDIERVEVAINLCSLCSVAMELNQSQRLIDIGKVASTLAHGVRNPLNAIKGAVVYLEEKYADEETLVEFIKITKTEISRLDDFISRFLSSSIADTEMFETDINSLLRKIEIFTSLQTRACNIESVYEYGNIPPIMITSFHIEQAILNVINNAIDAMQAGGQLKVRTRTENRSGTGFARIEVSDTGPGMTAKGIGDLPPAMNDKGKGFGLFITREILKYYGGKLEIMSEKDRGTTVRLFLPLK